MKNMKEKIIVLILLPFIIVGTVIKHYRNRGLLKKSIEKTQTDRILKELTKNFCQTHSESEFLDGIQKIIISDFIRTFISSHPELDKDLVKEYINLEYKLI